MSWSLTLTRTCCTTCCDHYLLYELFYYTKHYLTLYYCYCMDNMYECDQLSSHSFFDIICLSHTDNLNETKKDEHNNWSGKLTLNGSIFPRKCIVYKYIIWSYFFCLMLYVIHCGVWGQSERSWLFLMVRFLQWDSNLDFRFFIILHTVLLDCRTALSVFSQSITLFVTLTLLSLTAVC